MSKRKMNRPKAVTEPLSEEGAPAPVRVGILLEGARLTDGSRDAAYGQPIHNLGAQADLIDAYLKHRARTAAAPSVMTIDAHDVAVISALIKIGRMATAPKRLRDNYVDGAAYLAIAGELA